MATQNKIDKIEFLAKKLSSSKGVYLTDFSGMDVQKISLLRKKLREADVEYLVVKNTLTRIAAKREGLDSLISHLTGPTGLAIATKDELSPARVLASFRKEYESPRVKLAVVEGNLFQEKDVNVLANLPPKDVLFGQVAGALKKPLVLLSFCLQNALRQLLVGLDSLAKKKEADGGESVVPELLIEGEASNSQSDSAEVKNGIE